jgi:serine O-acetyltransferase
MRKKKAAEAEALRSWRRTIANQHPRLLDAVVGDARVTAANRGERFEFASRADALLQALRLVFVTDAFLAQVLYRVKARSQSLRVPIVPIVAHHLAMSLAQVCIGDPVVIQPGLYLPHGQVVIDGLVVIERGTVIAPFVTIGLLAGQLQGPTIESRAHIGTGAKILGPVRIGANATVGANSVVVHDVPAGATVVGVPARVVSSK